MKTINVWTSTFPIDDSGALVVHPARPPGANYFPATIIQWDGPPQRVFSEDQVKAMLNEMLEHDHLFVNARTAVRNIAAKHNIQL